MSSDRLTPQQRERLAASNYKAQRSRDKWAFACVVMAFLIVALLAFKAGCSYQEWRHDKAQTDQWAKETIAK